MSNVGDSRAIIGRPETIELEGPDGTLQSNEIMKAYDLTNDQTPFREDERNRVQQCGAQVLTMDEVDLDLDLYLDLDLDSNTSLWMRLRALR